MHSGMCSLLQWGSFHLPHSTFRQLEAEKGRTRKQTGSSFPVNIALSKGQVGGSVFFSVAEYWSSRRRSKEFCSSFVFTFLARVVVRSTNERRKHQCWIATHVRTTESLMLVWRRSASLGLIDPTHDFLSNFRFRHDTVRSTRLKEILYSLVLRPTIWLQQLTIY